MAMRLGLFSRKEAGREGEAKAAAKVEAERIKAEIRRLLDLAEEVAVAVNEIICADPACPGSETVILVMKPGEKTRAYKLQMPMAEVTADLLAVVLRQARA